jgi:hypothetical protein
LLPVAVVAVVIWAVAVVVVDIFQEQHLLHQDLLILLLLAVAALVRLLE